ncbi:hypothetical protein C0081_06540 [Cohaesibacter celericrescens]|uniref:Phytase-like domain-containing protein n=1 Tax=Cohaesibacter celericrescens TaxID=2067669 RepID=A0A2N5XUA8_9HYPH|nr:hypothetical protein C0081_06540 [Cohaesibacter celericrescens]
MIMLRPLQKDRSAASCGGARLVKFFDLIGKGCSIRGDMLRPVVFASCLLPIGLFSTAAISASEAISVLPQPAPKFQSIRVKSSPIDNFAGLGPSGHRLGKLIWVGGLELSSSEPLFGGFSDLAFLDQQRFMAVGDKGALFSARLVIDNGRPVGLDEARFRFIPGFSLKQPAWRRDAEGLAIVGNSAYVSFEGAARVLRYDIVNGEPSHVGKKIGLSEEIRKANRANSGLEAIAFTPATSAHAGSMVLISEAARKGRVLGWIRQGRRYIGFSLPQQDGLFVTAAAFTAGGDLVILERKVSLLGGLVIQIRRVRAVDFIAGDITRTDVLLRGTFLDGFDNMEGLAVQDLSDGSSLLSLISDDNFNSFQRTILLQFLLPAGT